MSQHSNSDNESTENIDVREADELKEQPSDAQPAKKKPKRKQWYIGRVEKIRQCSENKVPPVGRMIPNRMFSDMVKHALEQEMLSRASLEHGQNTDQEQVKKPTVFVKTNRLLKMFFEKKMVETFQIIQRHHVSSSSKWSVPIDTFKYVFDLQLSELKSRPLHVVDE